MATRPASVSNGSVAPSGFTQGSVGKHLFKLGSYMALGSISINLAQLSEAVYLGVVGTEALAALGFCFPITITLFAFAGGIGSGASSVIARAMGTGDTEQAARLVTHAQLLAVAIGVVLAIAGTAAADWMITSLGAKDTVREMAITYLHVYMLGFPFFMLSMVGSSLLRATGNAASPGLVMTFGSVLHIFLGGVLILGWFGAPQLGIAGAAWAYVISRFIAMFLYIGILLRVNMLRFTFNKLGASCAAILHVGAPAIAAGLIQPLSMLVLTRLLAGHGHEVVAGFNVASRVETMAHMILWSASSSLEPFIGQNWGARQIDRVRRSLVLGLRFCHGWAVFTFTMMMLFGTLIVSMIDPNPIVVAVAGSYFLIIPLSIGFMGMMQIGIASFNARGKPGPPLVMSFVRTVVVFIPLCIVANHYYGYIGIFVATALTNVLGGAVAWYWNTHSIAATAPAPARAAHAV